MFKVPRRQVYCETLADWARQTLWCHVVLRAFPCVHDFGSDPLVDLYLGDAATLQDQLRFLLRRAQARQRTKEAPCSD